jgi:hypothetical protein
MNSNENDLVLIHGRELKTKSPNAILACPQIGLWKDNSILVNPEIF